MEPSNYQNYRVLATAAVIAVFITTKSMAGVIRVDDDAVGANNGNSWPDAYASLQDALAAAQANDEVWVASGTYLPDQGASQTPGSRDSTFSLKSGVRIYGGFAGTEASLDQRAGLFDQTILSGDLLGDDGASGWTISDNAFHVVTGSGADATALLNGFFITGGFAEYISSHSDRSGGGLYIMHGSPRIEGCRFQGNLAELHGGGAYCDGGSASFTLCVFEDNVSVVYGGGACIFGAASDCSFDRCEFTRNKSESLYSYAYGGGIAVLEGSATISRCRFVENSALGGADNHDLYDFPGSGGAIYSQSETGTLVVRDCLFLGNIATTPGVFWPIVGGGIGGGVCADSKLFLIGCLFSGNTAEYHASGAGGGVFLGAYRALVAQCTFANNSAKGVGGGVYSNDPTPGSTTVVNSVLWNNSDSAGFGESAQIYTSAAANVDYCCVQNLSAISGTGNTSSSPLFLDDVGVDGIAGTVDDDLRLLLGSACIDSGDSGAVAKDETDLDLDGDLVEPVPFDLDGVVRFWDELTVADTGAGGAPVVDMGAYEYHGELCQQSLGYQGPGNMTLNICGDDLTHPGSAAIMQVAYAPASSMALLFASFSANPTPVPTTFGTVLPVPLIAGFPIALPVDANGNWSMPVSGNGNPAQVIYLQALAQGGGGIHFSNATELNIGL